MLFLVLLLAGPFFVLADCPAGSSCDPLTGTATPCPSPKYAPFNSYYCLSPPPGKLYPCHVNRLRCVRRQNYGRRMSLQHSIFEPNRRRGVPGVSGRV